MKVSPRLDQMKSEAAGHHRVENGVACLGGGQGPLRPEHKSCYQSNEEQLNDLYSCKFEFF